MVESSEGNGWRLDPDQGARYGRDQEERESHGRERRQRPSLAIHTAATENRATATEDGGVARRINQHELRRAKN